MSKCFYFDKGKTDEKLWVGGWVQIKGEYKGGGKSRERNITIKVYSLSTFTAITVVLL